MPGTRFWFFCATALGAGSCVTATAREAGAQWAPPSPADAPANPRIPQYFPARPPVPAPHRLRFRPRRSPVFLSAGYIASFVGGRNPSTAHGAEASLIAYLAADQGSLGFGPVIQYQNYDHPNHGRLGAGVEAAWVFGGLELLYAHRNAAAGHEATHGLVLGPYLSLLGIVHVAGRFTFALSPSGQNGFGNEYGVTLGLKVPLLIAGDFWDFGRGPE
jgi:hypothetical protein